MMVLQGEQGNRPTDGWMDGGAEGKRVIETSTGFSKIRKGSKVRYGASLNDVAEHLQMKIDTVGRVIGSFLVVTAYFIILHVNISLGVIMQFVGDAISVPFFIRTKSWDVVIMLAFLLIISSTKLLPN